MFRDGSQQAYSQAVGTNSTNYPVIDLRDPIPNDVHYPLGKFWINQANLTIWYHNSQSNITGNLQSLWILIGAVNNILSLSDTANTVVFPSSNVDSPPNNIQLVGVNGITITSDPPNNLITFDASGAGTVDSITGDDGVAVNPIAGTIQTLGNVVANSTHPKAVYTTTPGTNIENWDVQVAAAITSTDITKVGLAAFLDTDFNVDANGFVTLATSAGYISLTPYIVGQTGDVHAGFTGPAGIQDAIDQAVLDGASATTPVNIYIKPGTYTADLTLADGINLIGFTPAIPGFGAHQTVIITGTMTWTPGAGGFPVITISNVSIVNAGAPYYLTVNTNDSLVAFYNCYIEIPNVFVTGDARAISFNDCNCIFGSGGGGGLFDDTMPPNLDARFFNSSAAFVATACSTNNVSCDLFFFGANATGSGNITFSGTGQSIGLRIFSVGTRPFLNFTSTTSVPNITCTNSDCNFGLAVPNNNTVVSTFSNCITPSTISGVQPYDMTNCINEYNIVSTAINYQVLSQDRTISCTAGGITITMPANMPVRAITYVIKDLNGNAGSSNITINGNGHNIDGAATYTMNVNFGSVMLRWNQTSLTWMVI